MPSTRLQLLLWKPTNCATTFTSDIVLKGGRVNQFLSVELAKIGGDAAIPRPTCAPPVPPSIVREPRSSRCKACNEPRCLANVMRAVALNAASARCSGVGRRGWRTSIQPSIPDANEEVFVADLAALKDKFQRCRSIKSVSPAYRRARGLRNRMTQSECPDMELAEGMA